MTVPAQVLHRLLDRHPIAAGRAAELQAEYWGEIKERLRAEYRADELPAVIDWAPTITLDGRPWTLDRHEYLREPYSDGPAGIWHPHQTHVKATQMGLTSLAILKCVYGARWRDYRGILYLFPSRTDVLEFSKSRLTPLIADNPDSVGRWIRDTDSAGLKRIGQTFLYLRGMISRVGLKGVPVDLMVFDESDEAPQRMMHMATKRMAHSEYKEVMLLSNPTLPDYGIGLAYDQSDGRRWLLKCPACGSWRDMVEDWPECIREVGQDTIRACVSCGGVLDPDMGEWVAQRPDITRDRVGRQYSQLWSHYVPPSDILAEWRDPEVSDVSFFNLTIGIPYIEAEHRLSIEEVLRCCGDHGIASEDPGPCTMGVDQGKDLHVVIGRRGAPRGRILHIGVYRDWDELDRLMRVFHVSRCVVDALPNQHPARAFALRHGHKVFLSYYVRSQKGGYKWDEEKHQVNSNRTESLDSSHNEIADGAVWLPKRCEIVQEFAAHLHNVGKKLEENEKTGSKEYTYVNLGVDHFRHAYNFECMARHYGRGSFFEEVL